MVSGSVRLLKKRVGIFMAAVVLLSFGFVIYSRASGVPKQTNKLDERTQTQVGSSESHGERHQHVLSLPQPEPEVLTPALLIIPSIGAEGAGSVFHYLKQSAILAQALDARLIVSNSHDARQFWKEWPYTTYSASRFWNGEYSALRGGSKAQPPDMRIDARATCRLEDYLPATERLALVRGYCRGEALSMESMSRLRAELQNCTAILDAGRGVNAVQDLNGCAMGWVRERLAPAPELLPPPMTLPPTRPLTVGVHFRWGDTARKYKDHAGARFYGSIPVPRAVDLLADIARSELATQGMCVSVLMEAADRAVLAPLDAAGIEYTLVDTGAGVADLYTLAKNDILLLGSSSYAVLAHLLAPPGLTIVHKPYMDKFTNTSGFGREVVYLKDYKPESLLLAARPT